MIWTVTFSSGFAIGLVAFITWRHVIYPTFFSSLSQIPAAHFSCNFSNAWIIWRRYDATENSAVLAAHRQKGRIVRIGPDEVSINFIHGGVKSFAGNFEKSEWWPRLLMRYGQLPMAAMTSHKRHAFLRKAMQALYSNTRLSISVDFQKILLLVVRDSLEQLTDAADKQEPINVFALGAGAGLDACVGHFLGVQHRTKTVQDCDAYTNWMWQLDADEVSSFWTTELPSVVRLLSWVRLVPWSKQTQQLRKQTANIILQPVREAVREMDSVQYSSSYPESDLNRSCPLLCDSFRHVNWKSDLSPEGRVLFIATELLDQITAGSANIAVAIGYCCFELSRHRDLQLALHEEICLFEKQMGQPINDWPMKHNLLCEMDKLPLLEACLTETMRVYPPVTGQLPRRVPAEGFVCDEFFIPGGTTVSAAAYNLHREADAFDNVELWDPMRWIRYTPQEQKDKRAWLWMYGSGTYQCAGLHMARHMMNYWMASVYRNFRTTIIDHEGTEPQLAGLGFPVGRNLPVVFEKL